MKHQFVEHANCEREGNCPICDGGLAICTVCGAAEGELTTDCPGVQLLLETKSRVYSGISDYVNGRWVTP